MYLKHPHVKIITIQSSKLCECELHILRAVSDWPATMADLGQLHSFVGKILSLRYAGLDANLNLESKAGQVFVNLQVGLGPTQPQPQRPQPQPQPQSPTHHFPGPARIRRRQRRADARRAADQAVEEQENSSNHNAEEAPGNAEIVDPENEAEMAPCERIDVMKEKIEILEKENKDLKQSIKVI